MGYLSDFKEFRLVILVLYFIENRYYIVVFIILIRSIMLENFKFLLIKLILMK